MKAGCYLRVSTDGQDEENQREDVANLCAARGYEPVWFVDHGKSGKSTDGRSAYQNMMEQARRGRLKAVIFWKLDRLHRKTAAILVDMDTLMGYGVELISCRDPIDTTTATGRAMVGFLAVFAELEREQTVERINAAYRRKKNRAEALGQKVRWGRKEAEVPKEAIAMGHYMSARAIAEKLNISRRVAGYAVEVARNQGGHNAGSFSPETASGTESPDFVPGGNRAITEPRKNTVPPKEESGGVRSEVSSAHPEAEA